MLFPYLDHLAVAVRLLGKLLDIDDFGGLGHVARGAGEAGRSAEKGDRQKRGSESDGDFVHGTFSFNVRAWEPGTGISKRKTRPR